MDKTKRRCVVAALSLLAAANTVMIWGSSTVPIADSLAESSVVARLLSHILKNFETIPLHILVRNIAYIAEFLCLIILSALLIYFITGKKTMDKKKRRFAITTVGVLTALNIIFIWVNSSMSADDSAAKSSFFAKLLSHIFQDAEFVTLELFVRKLAHFTEFACLGMLSILLLYFIFDADLRRTWSMTAAPVLGCLFVASTDETIQVFSDRGNSVYDVILDLSGSVFAIIIFYAAALLFTSISRRCAASSAVKESVGHDGDIADGEADEPDDTETDGEPDDTITDGIQGEPYDTETYGEPDETAANVTPGEPEDTKTDGEPDAPEE